MSSTAPRVDADVLIMGDWNAPPSDANWAPFHALERANPRTVAFQKINDESDFSYLWLRNSTSKFVSRIDLTAMSLASGTKPPEKVSEWCNESRSKRSSRGLAA
jgi:hypothetical protein